MRGRPVSSAADEERRRRSDGTQVINLNGPEFQWAFVYRDGVYYLLYTEKAEQSRAISVNGSGDVIGEV